MNVEIARGELSEYVAGDVLRLGRESGGDDGTGSRHCIGRAMDFCFYISGWKVVVSSGHERKMKSGR